MDLETRVRRLERQNHRLKVGLLIGFLLLLVLPLAGVRGLRRGWFVKRSEPQRIVAVERLLLVDPQGATHARLSWDQRHGATFELNDDREVVRASLDVTAAGPGLTLYDARGKPRAVFQIGHDGPFTALTDEQGHELFAAPSDHSQ